MSTVPSRVPHGTRGLKFSKAQSETGSLLSRPAWDAWIEIGHPPVRTISIRSRPAWDAWIEIAVPRKCSEHDALSRPAWDAWIEIIYTVNLVN